MHQTFSKILRVQDLSSYFSYTVDILIKLACFVKNVNKIFNIETS
jgi:hypothetical protein